VSNMSNRKKIKIKTDQRKKRFLAGILLLISCCIVLTLIILIKPILKPVYEIESKVEDVEKSKKENTSDYKTTGWLKVQGTNIDLPVIGFEDMNQTVPVELGNYAWNLDKEEKFRNKVNIMGHNILNLSSSPKINLEYFSRFDDLMSFVYYDFAKENRYIQYTVDGKDYLYKIFAVNFETSYLVELYHDGNYTKKEMKDLIKRYKEKSIYNYDIDVDENDDIISVMTCTRFFGTDRSITFMVNGRLVRENEKIDNYKIEKSDNYKEVEKNMKGDEVNEEA